MKRGIVFITLLLVVFSMASFGKKLATLPGLFRPYPIAVDDQQLYVCDGVEVRIYSLEDYSLKAKFGKPGEGPQEFMHNPSAPASIMVSAFPEYLLVVMFKIVNTDKLLLQQAQDVLQRLMRSDI